jgi:hypothetical protein
MNQSVELTDTSNDRFMSTIIKAMDDEIIANLRNAEEDFKKAYFHHEKMQDALNEAKLRLEENPLVMGSAYAEMIDAIWAARHKESAAKDAMMAADKILNIAHCKYFMRKENAEASSRHSPSSRG